MNPAQQDQLRLSDSQANYSQICVPCKKTFYSQNAYNNHLSSKRHRIATVRAANRLDLLKNDDNESIAETIGSGTVSLDMMDSVANLDDVQLIQEGVAQLDIVDEEVLPALCLLLNPNRTKLLPRLQKQSSSLLKYVSSA
jgi:Zinc-finger double-stranded RNA-binding